MTLSDASLGSGCYTVLGRMPSLLGTLGPWVPRVLVPRQLLPSWHACATLWRKGCCNALCRGTLPLLQTAGKNAVFPGCRR